MEGLSRDTAFVFERIKDLDILSEYILLGGSALSIQIGHRLSEDLDFCKWHDQPGLKNKEIRWPVIEAEFRKLGEVKTDILDLYQVDFYINMVKVTFYSNGISDSRVISTDRKTGNIRLSSLRSLGATKLEVMSRRNLFRDYYDVYSILQEGCNLKDIVELCGKYSRHRMRSKMILAILSNGSLFEYDSSFEMLAPKYQVKSEDIEGFMRQRIAEEFS